MAVPKLSQQDQMALQMKIQSDPQVQAILTDPQLSTPMLRTGAVNNFLNNDPRSPVRDWFGADSAHTVVNKKGEHGGGYHYDPQTGTVAFSNTYGHPTAMRNIGLAAVGGAGGGAILAAQGGIAAGAGGAGAATSGGGGAAGGTLASSSIPLAYAPGATAVNAGALGSSALGGGGMSATGSFVTDLGKRLAKQQAEKYANKALDKYGNAGQVAGDIGQVAGGAASGQANLRLTEAQLNQGVDRNRLESSGQQITQNTNRDLQALDRAKLGISAPLDRTKQAAFGDALQNVQDVNIGFQPRSGTLPNMNITGGLRPSLYGANARAAGGELSRQALMALMSKSDVPAASAAIAQPSIGGYTKPSAGEKVLQGVGLAGGIMDTLGSALKTRTPTQEPDMPTMADMPTAPPLGPLQPSPQLMPPPGQQAYVNPNELDPTKQRNPYGVNF